MSDRLLMHANSIQSAAIERWRPASATVICNRRMNRQIAVPAVLKNPLENSA
jgi:hypothetical protein